MSSHAVPRPHMAIGNGRTTWISQGGPPIWGAASAQPRPSPASGRPLSLNAVTARSGDCHGTLTCSLLASALSIWSMIPAQRDCWLYDLWSGDYIGEEDQSHVASPT